MEQLTTSWEYWICLLYTSHKHCHCACIVAPVRARRGEDTTIPPYSLTYDRVDFLKPKPGCPGSELRFGVQINCWHQWSHWPRWPGGTLQSTRIGEERLAKREAKIVSMVRRDWLFNIQHREHTSVEYKRLYFALLQTVNATGQVYTDMCVPARNTFEAARSF